MRERRNAARSHDRSLLHNLILPPPYSNFDRRFVAAISAIHSYLSATIGSTFIARRAGK